LLGPETAHSPNAEDITTIYWVMLAVAGIFILAINGALVMFLIRYRAARGKTAAPAPIRYRATTRVVVALGVVAVAVFVLGVVYATKISDVKPSGPDGLTANTSLIAQKGLDTGLPSGSPDPLRIRAIGQQWIWRYEYPDPATGQSPAALDTTPGVSATTIADVFSYYELVVPVDTTVILSFDSTDVLHRWWVPGLSGKFDALPGTSNETWFRADETGDYYGQSAAFSGPSYAVMRTQVHVVSATDYQAWVTQQAADIKAAQTAVQDQLASGAAPGLPASPGAGTGGSQ
jgi:heme/copper-type cytochrome/quinol oxidase subunit 2